MYLGLIRPIVPKELREDIFAEDIFANRGSLSCEFRGRYFRESRIESQFRGRYFRDLKGQYIIFVAIIEERMFSEKNSDIFSTVLNLRVF